MVGETVCDVGLSHVDDGEMIRPLSKNTGQVEMLELLQKESSLCRL